MSAARSDRFDAMLARMARLRVLVIGDVMLDEYRFGEVTRISPEAPVPIVRVHDERCELGGAGNVARNVASLGARTELVGLVGRDREGALVRERAGAIGLGTTGLVESPSRPTTHKLRVVARAQQMLRLDREEVAALAPEDRSAIEREAVGRLSDCDAVILVDYDKGLFADGLGRRIVAEARTRGLFVAADPKRELERFRGASLVKPNWAEARASVGASGDDPEQRAGLLEKLSTALAGAEVVVTRGELGMSGLGATGRPFDVATRALPVFDVQGAGDTAMAALALARAAGATLPDACFVANAAAGIAVAKVGTAAVTRSELAERLADPSFETSGRGAGGSPAVSSASEGELR